MGFVQSTLSGIKELIDSVFSSPCEISATRCSAGVARPSSLPVALRDTPNLLSDVPRVYTRSRSSSLLAEFCDAPGNLPSSPQVALPGSVTPISIAVFAFAFAFAFAEAGAPPPLLKPGVLGAAFAFAFAEAPAAGPLVPPGAPTPPLVSGVGILWTCRESFCSFWSLLLTSFWSSTCTVTVMGCVPGSFWV